MRTPVFFAALAGLTLAATPAAALDHHNMPGKTVVEVAVGNSDFSTLVAAVKAAGLAETLSGKGPFTVFAPTNAAFAKLPAGTVETLLKPENKATLTSVLTYHVVPGRVNAAQLTKLIKDGGGTATLTTVQGGTIKASLMGDRIMLTDAKGGMSHVVTANVMASNGVIHAIDTVVMP
ncbi:fasciclin domain-containing protein [Sphingomonas humi]|uniref:Fasciclin domain-containing protein n=1 Tax=Sphingomonas humi TaxID=335630 RepID=A0ABP7RTJ9_9SPHN